MLYVNSFLSRFQHKDAHKGVHKDGSLKYIAVEKRKMMMKKMSDADFAFNVLLIL